MGGMSELAALFVALPLALVAFFCLIVCCVTRGFEQHLRMDRRAPAATRPTEGREWMLQTGG